MTARTDLPILPFATRGAWEAWLDEHHAASEGLWLKIAKKGSGIETVSYAEALEVALVMVGSTARKRRSTTAIGCNGSRRADRGASGRR
jgi:hypothetical protein